MKRKTNNLFLVDFFSLRLFLMEKGWIHSYSSQVQMARSRDAKIALKHKRSFVLEWLIDRPIDQYVIESFACHWKWEIGRKNREKQQYFCSVKMHLYSLTLLSCTIFDDFLGSSLQKSWQKSILATNKLCFVFVCQSVCQSYV